MLKVLLLLLKVLLLLLFHAFDCCEVGVVVVVCRFKIDQRLLLPLLVVDLVEAADALRNKIEIFC